MEQSKTALCFHNCDLMLLEHASRSCAFRAVELPPLPTTPANEERLVGTPKIFEDWPGAEHVTFHSDKNKKSTGYSGLADGPCPSEASPTLLSKCPAVASPTVGDQHRRVM